MNYLRYNVNTGSKVISASEMRDGLLWMDGVKGISVSTIAVEPLVMRNVNKFPLKVADVTKMFVVKYEKDGMLIHQRHDTKVGDR